MLELFWLNLDWRDKANMIVTMLCLFIWMGDDIVFMLKHEIDMAKNVGLEIISVGNMIYGLNFSSSLGCKYHW